MPPTFISPYLLPILMLIGSNVFMTTAWYWHLRYKEVPLFSVILISWGLAFFEYCLAVPANRWGSAVYTRGATQDHAGGDHARSCSRCSRSSISAKASPGTTSVGFTLIAAGAFFVFRGPIVIFSAGRAGPP